MRLRRPARRPLRALAAPARGEERFRIFVEAVQDYAIFMLDPDGVIVTWNAGAQRLKGYSAAEVIGQSFALFYTPEDVARNHPADELAHARAHGRYEEEGWRVRKDGTRFWANALITAVYERDGSIGGFAKVTRDVTERRRQEEQLRAREALLTQHLREREVLLQEVHHRVKNNLQVISSLINMQVRRLGPGASRDALVECQTRVLAIALIHEQLYGEKNYAQVRFAQYVRSLAASVVRAVGASEGVALDLAVDDVALGVDRAIPCGLVINELITNALKHAFPAGRRGTIRLALARHDERRLRLTVSDDGVGLPAGFDLRRTASMGMQLVRTLATQLDAELTASGVGGSSFQLTFEGDP